MLLAALRATAWRSVAPIATAVTATGFVYQGPPSLCAGGSEEHTASRPLKRPAANVSLRWIRSRAAKPAQNGNASLKWSHKPARVGAGVAKTGSLALGPPDPGRRQHDVVPPRAVRQRRHCPQVVPAWTSFQKLCGLRMVRR